VADGTRGNPACSPTAEGFWAVTQAIEREFGEVAGAIYRIGDETQRGALDAALGVLTLSVDDLLARTAIWFDQMRESATIVADDTTLSLPLQQVRNNFDVYTLVRDARERLGLERSHDVDFGAAVRAAYDMGPFADLFAIEGLGHDCAARLYREGVREGILTDRRAAVLPASTLTMMHAGLGLALAEVMLPRLTPCSPDARARDVAGAFIEACGANARPGYAGAAYEALGLVARMRYPRVMAVVDRALMATNEEVARYFWHGVGRGLYFHPAYIVPGLLSPWIGVELDAPHELARLNMHAGLAWAWTQVNIRHPEIVAQLLRVRGDRLRSSDAFSNGVASAIVVRLDVTGRQGYVAAFAEYSPHRGGASAADQWDELVRPAVRAAMDRYHPVLKARNRLDCVFRYERLDDLTERLAREPARTGA
jgi:hypothetical protein